MDTCIEQIIVPDDSKHIDMIKTHVYLLVITTLLNQKQRENMLLIDTLNVT
jgi:hypothetical protein